MSNSSTASYIVKLDISLDEFCNRLRKVAWPEWTSDRQYQSQVTKQIAELYKGKEEDPKAVKKAKLLETVLLGFGSKNPNERLIQILEHKGISVGHLEDCVHLHYFTSMHNCYDEGMSKLLKEIILHFLFELKGNKWMDFEMVDDEDLPW